MAPATRKFVCRSARRAGFTLVEVLATLAFAGIVFPVALHGVTLATSAAGVARQQAEAAVLAQTKLDELLVTGEWAGSGLSGDFAPDWPGYTWQVEVLEWDGVWIEQVDVHVMWTRRNVQHVTTLSTLVYTGME